MAMQSAAAAIVAVYLLCLLSLSSAKGHSRQCYEVGNETVCYFLLEDNLTMDWNDANKACRESNSTLAVIPNSDYQKAIQTYLKQHLKPEDTVVFTAGRKLWAVYPNPPWRWINGEQYQEQLSSYDDSQIFGCIQSTRITSCSFSTGSFICQYPESTCKMLDKATRQIRYGNQCFAIHDDDLRWNHARNKCIKGGGDLATFDGVNISMALRDLTSVTTTDTLYFIGLQKKWWTWQATESIINIRYSEWPERDHGNYKPEDTNGKDCLCLGRKYDFKWKSCDSLKGKAVVCQSESNPSKCYDLNGTQTCYLTPKYTKRLSFASATQWCRDHNATLPIIKNKSFQESLESSLKTIHLGLPVHLQWTSGLKVKTGIWTWINGQPFRDSDVGGPPDSVSFYLRSRSKETVEQKGRLLGSHGFEPNSANAGYICQFPGDVCKAISSVSDKCLVVNENQVTWYEARLRCINGGGDLATFEEASDVKKISSRLVSNNSYHIGLETSRWIWYQPDKLEDGVLYTNWNESVRKFSTNESDIDSRCNYTESEICARDLENSNFCLCLETSTYTWTPCDCDSSLRFVCQRDRLSSLPLKEADLQNEMCGYHGWIIAGVEGFIIAGLVIFIVFFFNRLRKESKAAGNADSKLHFRRHRDLANINRAMPSIPSEYQDLKLYDEIHETTCTCIHEIIPEITPEANGDIKTNDDIK